ncbi:cardiolipin synthase ClsB [Uliginosibacterium sp. H1]|uniref:cardiolipin synthase ClsB n=1 Tax=Uliginosibacterium sp. H1 TaxID=3114757 RepID=UPI002E197E40|nr:cardiolipin synthase ClsB [Uliginosibacterium sp. H1]
MEVLGGNDIRLLESGAQYFPALLAAIAEARSEVHLETYIYEADATGERITAALIDAVKRGIAVRVMVDGFGGRSFVRDTALRLLDAGVEVMIFRREIAALNMRRHRLRRLHRKLVVVDARLAFVGGINIIDDMNTPAQIPPRFDYAVRIEGPLLSEIHQAALSLWMRLRWADFHHRPDEQPRLQPVTRSVGTRRAAFVVRDNLRHRRDIEVAYLDAIEQARHEVILANAYFLPGWRFRRALMDAAARGVKVTLLLQGRVEYWLLHHACRALYPTLLDAGVRIIEYRLSFLHAKVAVVDQDWATVGSSNIDPFSLMLAREANVVVRDIGFTTELRVSLQRAMAEGGENLTRKRWRRQPFFVRGLSWAAYGLVRLLIGVAGYARERPER